MTIASKMVLSPQVNTYAGKVRGAHPGDGSCAMA
jgi:hypothetical protein